MEKNLVRERLVEAARLADMPRPAERQGAFTIKVEAIGIHITYIFRTRSRGHYSIDNITSWKAVEQCRVNPLRLAIIDLIKAARNFKP